jgi:hypothetical protein
VRTFLDWLISARPPGPPSSPLPPPPPPSSLPPPLAPPPSRRLPRTEAKIKPTSTPKFARVTILADGTSLPLSESLALSYCTEVCVEGCMRDYGTFLGQAAADEDAQSPECQVLRPGGAR